jgi:hypothetical protein
MIDQVEVRVCVVGNCHTKTMHPSGRCFRHRVEGARTELPELSDRQLRKALARLYNIQGRA